MYTFLLVILILDSLVLVASILMQAAKGGGLAASFGGVSTAADSFIGTRQAGNVLTKISWWAGAMFLVLAFAPPPSVVPLGTPDTGAPPPTGSEKKNP
jgi:preprotein translocase subunit SecG